MGRTTQSPYQVLGIPDNSDLETVKKSYKKLALKHHPDKNPGDKGSEERMKQINEAYESLSKPQQQKDQLKRSQDKTQGMDGQRQQHQQGVEQKVKAIDYGNKTPQPWVKATPTKGQQPTSPTSGRRADMPQKSPSNGAPKPESPGPAVAKENTMKGARDRKQQTPQREPSGPGSAGERPRRSRLQAFLELLGMTKFGQKILAKADKIDRTMGLMKDLFGRKPNKKRQFDPSVEQRQTQQARRFDQEKQVRIQQIIIIKQQVQAPGAPKPTPSQPQPKRALGDRAIGQHRQQAKPEVQSEKPKLGDKLKQDQTKTGPKQTKSAPIPRSQAPKQQLKQPSSTPGQKPLTGAKLNKGKDKALKSGPSLDDM